VADISATRIIVLCLRWYLRYPLSYRNLQEMMAEREEMMAERRLKLDHSTTARWVLLCTSAERADSTGNAVAEPVVAGGRNACSFGGNLDLFILGYRLGRDTIDFLLSPKRDLKAAKAFLQSATLQVDARRPRVINVDGHPAYPDAIEELKRSGELGRNCRCRRAPYLNNILEQDHRFVKKRMISSQWFRSVDGALRTIAGYEAMNIVRKGQIRWLPKADFLAKRSSSIARSASQPDLN
jgi:IS6 family transposase